ncbi:MAG: molybdopterin-dependent oxidoreductase [Microbacteriaceae bacterium]
MAAAAGLGAGAVGLGAAELVAALLGGLGLAETGEPFAAIGSLAIDLTPGAVREGVIGLFGTGDKAFLGAVLVAAVLAVGALAGLAELRRPPLGSAVFAGVGLLGLVAAVTRADGGALAALPAVVGAALSIPLLRMLRRRLLEWTQPLGRAEALLPAPRVLERRRFLGLLAGAGAGGAVVAVAARGFAVSSGSVASERAALRLPDPVSSAPSVPASAELGVDGLASWLTSAAAFYRIDTALTVPRLATSDWSLTITGLVDRDVVLGWDELLALPFVERYITLACVSNEVGGDLIGNARWLGVPVRQLLASAGPSAEADMVLSRSVDGFTAGTPLSVLQDEGTDALVAIGMNGSPLPLEHGYPARLVVPGLYGYVSATKWLTELKVTSFAADQGYWVPLGWAAKGPIKLASRIDTPHEGDSLDAGRVVIAGVAWRQHVGIAAVEVQIDDGDWQPASLATVVTVDSWLQWSLAWDATAGSHRIRVRATDAEGEVQTAEEAAPAPDGATGWHTIEVSVG